MLGVVVCLPSAPMSRLHFEDFAPGAAELPGRITVTRDDIVAFARDFDPQPFHLDEEAARASFAGRLIASGWHSCALLMRLVADAYVLNSTSMGAPGVEEVKWLRPVHPGDTLSGRYAILETKTSRSRPEMGFVRIRTELLNQNDETVLSQLNWMMMARRDAPAAEPRPARRPPPPGANAASAHDLPGKGEIALPFEDVAIGDVAELGDYTFTPEEIMRFARAFDPQPFHVDPEAAARSHFGGLCASGWHTASAWMRRLVDRRTRMDQAARERGLRPVRFGPSPGFRNLRWVKPVYAGETLTFRTMVADKKPSASRPDWGLVLSHNTGHNQDGELVYEFSGAGLLERRRA